MNNQSKQRPKRGRPVSGKKGFTLRTAPAAYEALRAVAGENGFSHVGDWVAALHGVDPREMMDDDKGAALEVEVKRRKFLAIGSEASRLLVILYELIDSDPHIADHRAVCWVLKRFERERRKLKRFMDREVPGRFPAG